MTREQYDDAIRQVVSAEWHEASQGDRSGWYDVTLKCNHTLTCLHHMLQSYMFCRWCFNAQ